MWLVGGFFLGLIGGAVFGDAIGLALTGAVIGGCVHLFKWLAKAGKSESVRFEGDERSAAESGNAQRLALIERQLRELTQRIAHLEQLVAPGLSSRDEVQSTAATLPVSPEPADQSVQTAVDIDVPETPIPAPAAAAAVSSGDRLIVDPDARAAGEVPSQPPLPPTIEEVQAAMSAETERAPDSASIMSDAKSRTDVEHAGPAAPSESEFGPETMAPREPGEPSWWTRIVTGNIVSKVGVLVMFFGVGFLLKYAADSGLFPPKFRILAVAAAGVAMTLVGWRLTSKRRLYGLILQGGGVGVLYLAVFFMLRWYGMVSAPFAFVVFAGLGAAAMLMAVRQDAAVLAVLGLTGAFLAPLLASTGSGNYVVLFSYYALLNCFIAGIAWFKAWRALNLTGFVFTFVVASIWGIRSYQPENFATVEPFLIFFFLLYLAIPILFALRQPTELKGLVDGSLVFGMPVAAAFLQAPMVRDFEYGLAWSAAVAGALYVVISRVLRRYPAFALLSEAHLALGLVFLTLAIPFAFDHYPTFGLWTLEGAAIVWVGLRQGRLLARCFGYLVHFAGVFFLLRDYPSYSFEHPVFNGFVLGCVLVAAAAMVMGLALRANAQRVHVNEAPLVSLLPWWSVLWWYAGGLHALHYGVSSTLFPASALAFVAISSALLEFAGTRLSWPSLRLTAGLLTLAMGAALFSVVLSFWRPFENGGVIAWPLALAVHFWTIHCRRRDNIDATVDVQYWIGLLAAAAVATMEAWWALDHEHYLIALAWGVAGIAGGWLRWRLRERDATKPIFPVSLPMLVWGLLVWFAAGASWCVDVLPAEQLPSALLAFAAVSCLLFEIAGSVASWPMLRRTQLLLTISMGLAIVATKVIDVVPFDYPGWIAWPLAAAVVYAALYRQERVGISIRPHLQHFAAVLMLTLVAAWQVFAWMRAATPDAPSWFVSAWMLVLLAVALASVVLQPRVAWPLQRHSEVYLRRFPQLVLAVGAAWSLYVNMRLSGDGSPVLYLPVLNPIDLVHVAWIGIAVIWQQQYNARDGVPAVDLFGGRLGAASAALIFIWINAIMLRSLHHWAGVAYEARAIFDSVLAQAAVSILWSVIALIAMVHAVRNVRRIQWIAGAVLLAAVVAKLFLLDLANTGTLARIVSFLGVGLLLLAIGYFAPVPPGEVERDK